MSAAGSTGNYGARLSAKRARANNDDDKVLSMIAYKYDELDALDMEDPTDTHTERNDEAIANKRKRKRTSRTSLARWTNADGTFIRLVPRQSYWYMAYIAHPDREDKIFLKKFRLRFRLPYDKFEELAESLEHVDCFKRWHNGPVNASRVRSAPIPLLVLTSLRYLGRGLTFDDLEEGSWCNGDVIRVFFHKFVQHGSTALYDKYIRSPVTHADALLHTEEYKVAGFPGAVGSTDATHILIERLQSRFRQSHVGFKMSHTARRDNVTVNHRRQILSSTRGHPARWNDKTLATFDDFMQKINDVTILNDSLFELYDFDDDNAGVVIKRTYRGAWLLVDNGYHSWPTTVPPIKTSIKKSEIRFSSWLESMRKDVECTFGILKGRWRILKSGIRILGVECADNIFLTCCALHNWLLEIDGLDKEWRNGVPSDWEGEIGEATLTDITAVAAGVNNNDNSDTAPTNLFSACGAEDDDASTRRNTLPAAICRLLNPVAQRGSTLDLDAAQVELLRLGEIQEVVEDVNDHTTNDGTPVVRTMGGVHIVRNLSLPFFQSKLVQHFDIAFKR